jgi:CheY-like chemotaxis protein
MSSSPFSASGAHGEPTFVVVADDVLEIQQLLHEWLSGIGCVVMCVSTGREAVRLLRMQQVDVVITDILMPDGDGLEVISELKRTHASTRVLAISGGGNHLRAHECLKFAKGLGAHGMLMKPFNRQQLLDAFSTVRADGTTAAL